MSKRQLLCALGVWVMIFLFLGLPSFYDKIIAVVTGFVILVTSYTIPAPRSTYSPRETFVDSKQE